LKNSGVSYFPTATINNKKYLGSIQGKDILEAVCATIKNPSKECKNLVKRAAKYTKADLEKAAKENGPNVTFIVMIVVAVLFVFFLFMIFIYRRMVTKDV